MADQLNITTLNQETDLQTTDRMLLWDATVSSKDNIKYVTVAQLSASVATYVTPTVINSGSASYIIKPSGPSTNSVLTYNGTTWVASSTLPTNTVVRASIQNNAINADKIDSYAVTNDKLASAGFDASKITVGTLAAERVGALDASKITTGTFGDNFIASGITASKISNGISSTQISSLAAGKITGQLAVANGGTGASTALGALTALSGYGGPNDAKPGRRIFIQTADPTTVAGGSYTLVDGDLWFKI